MLVPASPAGFTNSDTKLDGLPAIPFFILLIDSLTIFLSVK